jgi:hypothetical protein
MLFEWLCRGRKVMGCDSSSSARSAIVKNSDRERSGIRLLSATTAARAQFQQLPMISQFNASIFSLPPTTVSSLALSLSMLKTLVAI